MLITKTVKIKWNINNMKWYKSKGYVYTKTNNEFEVKVEDLTAGSHVKVEVSCDCPYCKTPIMKPVKWQDYLKCVKEDGKYYCNKCCMKLYGAENMRKSRLKNGKSFEQWCVENSRLDVLERWDYELNNYKPNEINCFTNKKYYFKCPNRIHKSELKKIHAFVSGSEGSMYCKSCNSFAMYLIDTYGENALESYWDYEKNKNIDPWKIEKRCNKKVWIKCDKVDYHGSYKIGCSSFYSGNRCGYCGNFKVHPLDSLGKYLEDKGLLYLWSEKNKKSPYEYLPKSNQKVWWKCVDGKHEDYKRSIYSSTFYEFRCPECSREREESFLQEKVRMYLNELGYELKHEYNCSIVPKNPKTNHGMPFDNEININNKLLFIEVHGMQHYKICKFNNLSAKRNNTTPEYELHMQQVRDRYKRIYAKSHGYEYLEIPYWTDNKKDDWKKLINNKIKQITNNENKIY